MKGGKAHFLPEHGDQSENAVTGQLGSGISKSLTEHSGFIHFCFSTKNNKSKNQISNKKKILLENPFYSLRVTSNIKCMA